MGCCATSRESPFMARRRNIGSISKSYTNIEKTVVLIQPDGVKRGLVGGFMNEFEERGMKLVGIKMFQPERDQLQSHFSGHTEEDITRMMSGPICVMVMAGDNCIENAKQIIKA